MSTTLHAAASNPAVPALAVLGLTVARLLRPDDSPTEAPVPTRDEVDQLFDGELAFPIDRSIRAQIERRVDQPRLDWDRYPYDRHRRTK